jgi:hypothetical protein
MIHVIIWIVIFAIWYFYRVYRASVEEKEREYDAFYESLVNSDKDKEENMNVGKCLDERTTTGLVLTTLRSIGCDPETEEKGGLNYAYFTFQGEKFTIESNDQCYFVTIYDTWWHSISIYSDVDDIADLHRTINLANQHVNCTLLYTTNNEIEEIGVHSRRTILFRKEIPELDKYLISVLNDFFKAQRLVLTELDKCKVEKKI